MAYDVSINIKCLIAALSVTTNSLFSRHAHILVKRKEVEWKTLQPRKERSRMLRELAKVNSANGSAVSESVAILLMMQTKFK